MNTKKRRTIKKRSRCSTIRNKSKTFRQKCKCKCKCSKCKKTKRCCTFMGG